MARAIWKGTLGFGLVSIGIELLSAESAAERLDLDLLDRRDMARIGYEKINKVTGKTVEPADIVKGYQVAKGRYVLLDEAEIKAAHPKSTQTIEILGFVARDDVPVIYFDKPYYLKATKGSEKAYALFRDALIDADKLALAQLVVHTRQYRAAVFPMDGALVAQLLRYRAELRSPEDGGIDDSAGQPTVRKEERAMARQLIETMAIDWDPDAYKDEFRGEILALVKRRAKEGEGAAVVESGEPAPEPTRILDLVAALKRSIEEGKGKSDAPAKSAKSRPRTRRRRSA